MKKIETLCQQIINENPTEVQNHVFGQKGMIGLLTSKVIQKDAQIDVHEVVETLTKLLKKC